MRVVWEHLQVIVDGKWENNQRHAAGGRYGGGPMARKGVYKERHFISVATQVAISRRVQRYKLNLRVRQERWREKQYQPNMHRHSNDLEMRRRRTVERGFIRNWSSSCFKKIRFGSKGGEVFTMYVQRRRVFWESIRRARDWLSWLNFETLRMYFHESKKEWPENHPRFEVQFGNNVLT